MHVIGEADPAACVFVGDGPTTTYMAPRARACRAVLISNSDVPPYEAAVPDAIITRPVRAHRHLDRWS